LDRMFLLGVKLQIMVLANPTIKFILLALRLTIGNAAIPPIPFCNVPNMALSC